jgi:hypothetical protein
MVQASLQYCSSLLKLLSAIVGWLFVMDADTTEGNPTVTEETQLMHASLLHSVVVGEKQFFVSEAVLLWRMLLSRKKGFRQSSRSTVESTGLNIRTVWYERTYYSHA